MAAASYLATLAVLSIIQWNAQGMSAHGHELLRFVDQKNKTNETIHLICIQETWFSDDKSLYLPGYTCILKNRKSQYRGGCAFYIHDSIQYADPLFKSDLELQTIDLYFANSTVRIINFYNPCKQLNNDIMEELKRSIQEQNKYIIVGDFNSHNTLWGSEKTDHNGKIIETFINETNMVLLNDGSGTRMDPRNAKVSVLDLSITSPSLSGKCDWCTMQGLFGSDHYPISIQITLDKSYIKHSDPNIQPEIKEIRRSFRNMNWTLFSSECEKIFTDKIKDCVNKDPIELHSFFIDSVTNIIQKISPPKVKQQRKPIPWWNKTCSDKIKERNKARRKLNRTISIENLNDFLKKKAEAQKFLRECERQYWNKFCQKLNRYIPESNIWACIKRLNGVQTKAKRIPVLKYKNTFIQSDQDKANLFGNFFHTVFTTETPKPDENIQVWTTNKRNNINDSNSPEEKNRHVLNESFSIGELNRAIEKKRNSSPGKDGIPYIVYQNLPLVARKYILFFLNLMWESKQIPPQLKHSVMVPILKQNADSSDVSSYRPIALSSCLIKIMETMIKSRLDWFLEKHELLPPFMNGFRRGRSVIDSIVNLENDVQKHINNKEHTLAVFLDINKAYDTIWIDGLIHKLKNIGIQGNILHFFYNFLLNRTYQVRVGSKFSQDFKMDRGLPQGSILSPTLFNIMLSDIPTDPSIKISLYADDCAIWISGKNIPFITQKMQSYLNVLYSWFISWGLQLSQRKTVPLLFTKSTKVHELNLTLNKIPLKCENTHRFLGILFDKKLTWVQHIENIANRCKKKMNILRCLTGTPWGSSSKSLIMVYRAYIRSLLDYGCEAYDSASDNVKKVLDSIQYQCLRICAGALPLTPLASLQVEMGEAPLDLRRQQIALKYKHSIEQQPTHPVFPSLQPCWQYHYMDEKHCNKPFGYRTANSENLSVERFKPLHFPPWLLVEPVISTELSDLVSKSDNPIFLQQMSLETINTKWNNQLHIFTDGSKLPKEGRCSASFCVPAFSYQQSKRLRDGTSSYRGELAAIMLALNWVKQLDNLYVGAVIFCDSLSALLAIKNKKEENFISEILVSLSHLKIKSIDVSFEWIPSHCGIIGNERADFYAKAALAKRIEITNHLNISEANSILESRLISLWQTRWENSPNSHYRRITNLVSQSFNCTLQRPKEKIIRQLRLGVLGLNEDLGRMKIHPTGHCDFCQEIETVEHYIVKCPKYIIERSMLIAEANIVNQEDILKLLNSQERDIQNALYRFVQRTKRFNKKSK